MARALRGWTKRHGRVVAAVAAAAALATGGLAFAGDLPDGAAQPARDSVCPPAAHVLDGVYRPGRLHVLNPCVAAGGRIASVQHEPDGDVHMLIRLTAADRGLVDAGNMTKVGGNLVAELMPRDSGHIAAPRVGQQVRVVGAWMHDRGHGWNEIHPIWSLSVDGGAAQVSGPRYGGAPASATWRAAAADCRTASGASCGGYPAH